MPGYNVEKMIKKTFDEIPRDIVSEVILVDDGSTDNTAVVAEKLGIRVFRHPRNLGYGAAQKTGYREALKNKPDVVAMIHSDYQHDATYLGKLIEPVLKGDFDIMTGSRTSSRRNALSGGMPLYKYVVSRVFSIIANTVLGEKISEHLCGFRAYNKKVLETLPFMRFSDNYVFDNQFMISALAFGFKVGEIPIPTRYLKEATSSVTVIKGIKVLYDSSLTLFKFILFKLNTYTDPIFKQ